MFNKALWNDPEIDNNSFSYREKKLNENRIIFDYGGDPWSIKKLNQQLKYYDQLDIKNNEFNKLKSQYE